MKLNPKKLEKIYVARVSKIKFKYFCILPRNQYIRGNHSQMHFIIFLLNEGSFAYKTEQKNFFTKRVEKCKFLNLVKNFYGGQLLRPVAINIDLQNNLCTVNNVKLLNI